MPLPTHTFNTQEVKIRRGERYTSQAVNKKFLVQPRGVYAGYLPAVSAGSRLLTLAPDQTYGISFCRVRSSAELSSLDVITDQPVVLDFTGHDFVADPIAYVIITASASLGGATTSSIFTRATIAVDPLEQPLHAVRARLCAPWLRLHEGRRDRGADCRRRDGRRGPGSS